MTKEQESATDDVPQKSNRLNLALMLILLIMSVVLVLYVMTIMKQESNVEGNQGLDTQKSGTTANKSTGISQDQGIQEAHDENNQKSAIMAEVIRQATKAREEYYQLEQEAEQIKRDIELAEMAVNGAEYDDEAELDADVDTHEKEYQRLREERLRNEQKEYMADFTETLYEIDRSIYRCETMGAYYYQAMKNAIKQVGAYQIGLRRQRELFEKNDTIATLKDEKQEIEEKLERLDRKYTHPLLDHEGLHEKLKEYVEIYREYYELVIDPYSALSNADSYHSYKNLSNALKKKGRNVKREINDLY
ncbi:hypothetical protein ACFL27_27745 [candidate division CSSED10-310 bacterium]|uniref:Uncharacterized protein n=1 Tax=candidate division CSSED10-310 bacterium TaxID=2855610 RepID=A0ABV6Z6K9_UNCC1